MGEALGEWQAAEVAGAWRYPQCRGLSDAQLEDLYQETVLALLNRPFFSEEHLRNALRVGLRNRALHVHRDERRRGEILSAHAPEAQLAAVRRSEAEQPEHATLVREDGLIVLEFAAGLSELEQQVYALEGEGLRYRAIAPIIGRDVNETRKASRELKEKYARFRLLHDTGRLCGYRAPTIRALLDGEQTSEQLARAAFAHLRSCTGCRQEHSTNAARLKRSFEQRAAALLPLPALLEHGRLGGLWLRARLLAHRLVSSGAPTGGGARERTLALIAGGGASVKVAAGVATVVAVAGGTLGASSGLHGSGHRHRPRTAHLAGASATVSSAVPATHTAGSAPAASPAGASGSAATKRPAARREPDGFAFLGVGGSTHTGAHASAASTRDSPTRIGAPSGSLAARTSSPAASVHRSGSDPQHGGGPFSP